MNQIHFEKRFGSYRQLSSANYFGSEKQLLDAEKSLRVKSPIKFSGYTMKKVSNIMTNDSFEAQAEVKHCGNIINEMLLTRFDNAHMTQMDSDIVYYVAGFTSKSVKRTVPCVACDDILGEESALEINIEGMIPENCQFFVDEINRGDHVKPSDLIYAICALA